MTTATKCKAHNRDGTPCRNHPLHGATVCRMHGGKSPQAQRGARRRIIEQRVQRLAVNLTAQRDTPPAAAWIYDELIESARLTVAWRDILTEQVQQLEALTHPTPDGLEQLDVTVQLFERAMERSSKTLEQLVRLNAETRMDAMNQATGQKIVDLLREIEAALNLTPEQKQIYNAEILKVLNRWAADERRARE